MKAVNHSNTHWQALKATVLPNVLFVRVCVICWCCLIAVLTESINKPAWANSHGNADSCNCSCDFYWGVVGSVQDYASTPSQACVRLCTNEYLLCQANPPESMQVRPRQDEPKIAVAQGEQRRIAYADQIEYYAKSIGLTTPEMLKAFTDGIVNASDDEVRQLLDIVKTMREEKSN